MTVYVFDTYVYGTHFGSQLEEVVTLSRATHGWMFPQVAGQNGMPAIPHAPSTARLQSTAAGPQQHAALPNGIPQHSGPGIRGVAQPILPQFGVGVAAQVLLDLLWPTCLRCLHLLSFSRG